MQQQDQGGDFAGSLMLKFLFVLGLTAFVCFCEGACGRVLFTLRGYEGFVNFFPDAFGIKVVNFIGFTIGRDGKRDFRRWIAA